jgi:hypothetical protein
MGRFARIIRGDYYVEGSTAWYVHSTPRPTHDVHDGCSLSHLVRRRRHVRQAWTARFRGYVAFSRGCCLLRDSTDVAFAGADPEDAGSEALAG